jgi:hypothetical protein
MKVYLQPAKEAALRQVVSELIKFRDKKVKAKFLAKVLGKIISSSPGLGQIPLIFARLGYFALEKAVDANGWGTMVHISTDFCLSLNHFLDQINIFNGHPILHSANSVSLLALLGPPDKYFSSSFAPLHIPELPQEIFASDASNIAVCTYSFQSESKFFFIGSLSEEASKLSSGHRELLAVKLSLQAKLASSGAWKSWTNIFWLTDSENLVTFLTKGSTKIDIQQTILQVFILAKTLKIRILPIHLKRDDPRIGMADSGSRIRDSDDWSLDQFSFNQLNIQFGPFSLDVFADSSNAKTQRFFSDFRCPDTLGIDAFAHSWENENVWICPPVSKILQAIRKIQISKVKGLLIVPNWKSADFYPFLFPRLGKQYWFVKQIKEIFPTINQNQRALSPLNGKTQFSFLAVQINSR